MKKSFKKLLAVISAFAIVFTLSATAFAASVTKNEAKTIALNDAGVKNEALIYVRIESDNENGTAVWDIEFTAEILGLYHEFDYTVRKSDGKILDKDYELETVPFSGEDSRIDKETAKGIAVKEFGINIDNAKFTNTRLDIDDGKAVYDIEFVSGDVKYSCEITESGRVTEKETDSINTLEEKIEIFIELIIEGIRSVFAR